jgi:organic hydroperoxide reductase OsmC/OhrA
MSKDHYYQLSLKWTGNKGEGTASYTSYERSHVISGENKPEIQASSDPAFRGDHSAYNPEELLVASLSGCHMLWFLHLCAKNGIVVVDYTDNPTGVLMEEGGAGGRITSVTLNPVVTVSDASALHKLDYLHKQANQLCFIANSVNFKVSHNPTGKVAS